MAMTSIAPEEINALEIVILGRRNWLAEARAGKIKRSPEQIDRKADVLRHLEAMLGKVKERVDG